VARNRKRAKERRARRPANGDPSQPATATARFDAPDPIEHASPDVELAEAQLAIGRPELAPDPDGEPGTGEEPDEAQAQDGEPDADEEFDDAEFGEAPNVPGVFPARMQVQTGDEDVDELADEELALAEPEPSGPPEHRPNIFRRLIHFLQGSWRELQRVQWPDRRQVMQATGVVIGFVIVAGVFLGVADFLATKIMNYILTGHFK
jgi:preprotein translocase SecE subunit